MTCITCTCFDNSTHSVGKQGGNSIKTVKPMCYAMRRFPLVVLVIWGLSNFEGPKVFVSCLVKIPCLAFLTALFLALTELNSDIDDWLLTCCWPKNLKAIATSRLQFLAWYKDIFFLKTLFAISSVLIFQLFFCFSVASAQGIFLLRFSVSSKLYTEELPALLLVLGSEQVVIFFWLFFSTCMRHFRWLLDI